MISNYVLLRFNYFLSYNQKLFRRVGQFRRPQIARLANDDISEYREMLLEKNAKFSNSNFKSIRTNLIEKFRHINKVNVDAIILGLCDSPDQLNIAQKYIKFLNDEGIETNNAIWGRLLKIYYMAYKNKSLTKLNSEEILNIYENIKNKNAVLDASTCENLILGIIGTDHWKISLELLEMIKLTSIPNVHAYNAIAAKAFLKKSDYQIGWDMIEQMVTHQKQPSCEVFIDFFENLKDDKENLENMLNTISSNEIIISMDVIKKLQEILSGFNVKSSLVSLTHRGKCPECGSFMERISISTKEFNKLRSSFLEKVLIRNDIFLKSTPEEIDQFVKFIDDSGPFHCIIDGLNVAYSCGVHKNTSIYANLLVSIVQYFVDKNKKILILGRKHMNKWPKDQMNYIKKKSKLFLTNNLSQDDPFLLYAALKSGPATDFFSRDLMRSHSFLLEPELKYIFKKWQQEHQYSLVTTTNKNKVIVKEPIKFNFNAHKVNGTWHLPYREKYLSNPGKTNELSNSWLCFSL